MFPVGGEVEHLRDLLPSANWLSLVVALSRPSSAASPSQWLTAVMWVRSKRVKACRWLRFPRANAVSIAWGELRERFGLAAGEDPTGPWPPSQLSAATTGAGAG